MATLTIRNLDEQTKAQQRIAAAHHGQSMAEEVRAILRQAQLRPAEHGLGSRIHHRFAAVGGVQLPAPARDEVPCAAELPQ